MLQSWEGRVVSINDETFEAALVDITACENEENEQIELPIDDLRQDDLARLQLGTIFTWLIGYRYFGATKERFSRIVFRSLPPWTEADFARAEEEVERRQGAIRWD